jgi:hypothetical protein
MGIVRSDGPDAGADRYDQLVFYLPDDAALAPAIEPLLRAGLTPLSFRRPGRCQKGATGPAGTPVRH